MGGSVDNYTGGRHAAEDGSAIRFTGNWKEYLPIAATNLLLTIVTLGVYRFWATARQRRYLWSRTHVIDDSLEWTGTGKEMFVGFLMVVAILLPFFLFIQFVLPALVARGMMLATGGLMLLFYVALLYFGGVARFRALRYRLSRTWWHGIRGGSDDPGWAYGAEYLGRYGLSVITLFIMFPWAATRLWSSRWSKMSYGPHQFHAEMTAAGLKGRWAAIYLVPICLFFVVSALGMVMGIAMGPENPGLFVVLGGFFLLLYLAIPLLTLHWFAKFYRRAAAETTLGNVSFSFDARTWDWFKLFLGNIGLAIVTLGLGITFWGYRNWSFMVRHLHMYGDVHLDDLTQSQASAPGEAEGFADAFDVGAF